MRVEEYRIKDWEDTERGLLIDENDNWILVKHIPVDYLVDGYKIYKKEFLEERIRTRKEEEIEKVLRLKGIENKAPIDFKFTNTIGLLDWVESKFGIFEFQDDDESELFYGKRNRINENTLIIDMINSDGSIEFEYDYEFEINSIRVLTFETDYHQSIRLLWMDQLKNK